MSQAHGPGAQAGPDVLSGSPRLEPHPDARTRCVVTGNDAQGRSCIVSDTHCSAVLAVHHPQLVVIDAWQGGHDSLSMPLQQVSLTPRPGGNVFRIVRLPPDRDYIPALAAQAPADARHPLMHQTPTLDYVTILQGEVHLIMEHGETLLCAGDVVVQRGTNHAWSNRSEVICMMAVVLNSTVPVEIVQA